MKGLRAYLKERPEVGFFALAAVIFAVGAATFLGGKDEDSVSLKPAASPSPGAARVGPVPGDSIPAYIERKKADLEKAAAERAGETRFAVATFTEYRKPKDVDQFLSAHKVSALTAQWRVPRPDFQPAEVGISSDVASALSPEIEKVIDSRRKELAGLEGYINSTDDAQAVAVFREDADRVQETIQFLESDPPLVYAIVIRATNTALATLSKTPELRLVDTAADARLTPRSTEFSGVLPEATDKA